MQMRQQGRARGVADWLLAVAEPAMVAVLLCYLLYQFLLGHVEGDQAYLLYAAQQMLHGVQLDGPQLIETNPPLIVWFSEIPALLGRVLHVQAVLALRLVTLGMLAGSAAWGWRLLHLAGTVAALGRRAARVLWAATFLLITLTQPAEFGQREQLLLALFLPYLLAVGSGVVVKLGMAERIALGACAGLAVCFKPQHLLTIVCLEVFIALYTRSVRRLRSPELLTAVLVGVLYVGSVRLFTPAYLLVITPLLRDTYWALGEYSLAQMALHVGRVLSLASVCVAGAWWLLRRRLALARFEGAMLASGVGAVLAYFQQHTGWYHQRFPATALLEIGAVWIIADLARDWLQDTEPMPQLGRLVWAVLPLCGLLLFAGVWARKRHVASTSDDLQAELTRLPRGTTVYAFSVGMNAFPVVEERQLTWGSRFAHLWMVPAIRANEAATLDAPPAHVLPQKRVAQLAGLQRSETTQDLARTQPAAVFVEQCTQVHPCGSYHASFDAVAWFSQDAGFASVWAHYALCRRIDGFDMYVRVGVLPCSA